MKGTFPYIIKTISTLSGSVTPSETKILIISHVGIRNSDDLKIVSFLGTKVLPAERSIYAKSTPVDYILSENLKTLCSGVKVRAEPVNIAVNSKLSGSFAFAELREQKNYSIQWKSLETDTAPYPDFISKKACKDIRGYKFLTSGDHLFVVEEIDSAPSSIFYFNGEHWMDLKQHLTNTITLPLSELQDYALAVKDENFSLYDSRETRDSNHSTLFPDRRPEFLFSIRERNFLGVIWHWRK